MAYLIKKSLFWSGPRRPGRRHLGEPYTQEATFDPDCGVVSASLTCMADKIRKGVRPSLEPASTKLKTSSTMMLQAGRLQTRRYLRRSW
jgi:hypothetical protein